MSARPYVSVRPLTDAGILPGQQFLHVIHRMAGNRFKNVPKIRFRIEPVQLVRFDEAIDRRRALAFRV